MTSQGSNSRHLIIREHINPLRHQRNIWNDMHNMTVIGNLGDAVAPMGLQGDPPLSMGWTRAPAQAS